MREKIKAKREIFVGVVVAFFVLLTMYFYLANAGDIRLVVVALTLVVFALYIFWDSIKSMRKGLPAKDERLTNIKYKAGHYAFIAAIWSAVGSSVVVDIILGYELQAGDITGIVVLVSGFTFVLSYLYMLKKGD